MTSQIGESFQDRRFMLVDTHRITRAITTSSPGILRNTHQGTGLLIHRHRWKSRFEDDQKSYTDARFGINQCITSRTKNHA